MRHYLPNSPEAAARIVALVLISDGNVCQSEIDTLRQLEIEQNLGLAPGAFANVVKDLCEDLLMGAHGHHSLTAHLDDSMLASFMGFISEPGLREKILCLAGAAARADRHLAEAEARVMQIAWRRWLPAHAPSPAL